MGPGLPGFGIASVFYIVAALFAPLRLLPRRLRGDIDPERWSAALTQFLIGAGMLAALVGFYAVIDLLIRHGLLSVNRGPDSLARLPNWILAAGTLVLVLGIGSLAGWLAERRSPDDHPHEIAAAHRAGVVEMVRDLRAGYARRDLARRPRRAHRPHDLSRGAPVTSTSSDLSHEATARPRRSQPPHDRS